MIARHWNNPYRGAVSVPLDELIECYYSLDMPTGDTDGSVFIMTKERIREHVSQYGDKVDAYILPCPSGYHSMGIRYGNGDSEYLSPLPDRKKIQALLRKYL